MLIKIDGMDHYNSTNQMALYTTYLGGNSGDFGWSAGYGTTYGRFAGSNGIFIRTSGAGGFGSTGIIAGALAVLLNPENVVVAGIGISHLATYRVDVIKMYHTSASTTSVTARVDSNGMVKLITNADTVQNNNGTIVGTYGPIDMKRYPFFELKAVAGPLGSAELRMNGRMIISASNVPIYGSNSSSVLNMVKFGAIDQQCDIRIDDMYVLNTSGSAPFNDWLGDKRIWTQFPSGSGSVMDWTGSGALTYQGLVNQTNTDGDTTYAAGNTGSLPATALYTLPLMSGSLKIGGIARGSYLRTDEPAPLPDVRHVVKKDGVVFVDSSSLNVTSSYLYSVTPIGNNPSTGLPWTLTEFNALEVGVRRIS